MYIKNASEIIPILRGRLSDYLCQVGALEPGQTKMLCPIHQDSTPSMVLNPKANYEVAHCFSCGANVDIFRAANIYEQLPETGGGWMTETVPVLAKRFEIPIEAGEISSLDREKLKLYKLAQDIADIIESPVYRSTDYLIKRNWTNDLQVAGSIAESDLINQLMERGWTTTDINTSLMVRTSSRSFFGEEKVTFTIRDLRGKAIGFISRNLGGTLPKYINTTETLIYEKRKTFLGLDHAIKPAKFNGLYVVEGPGDLQQLYRLGIRNAVSVCGTAVTAEHLNLLKMLGIRNIYLCLDWDQAGILATARIFDEALKTCPGVSCWVVEPPSDMGENTDPDSYLVEATDSKQFTDIPKTNAFEWVMRNSSDNNSPDIVCQRMIPIIASEPAAVKRELLIKQLQEYTGLSYQAITSDVSVIRDGSIQERRDRLLAATDKYRLEVERNPEDIGAALAQYENDIYEIERDYERDSIGVSYQLSRFDAIQELKGNDQSEHDKAVFSMSSFPEFSRALQGGMSYTSGTLMYFGGRANAGKTAVVLFIALDVALTDPETIVIIHSTDDAYIQIEPRLKANISKMICPEGADLTIGMTASPYFNINTAEEWAQYNLANQKFRELIAEEKLVIIDSEDGASLSVLERTVRYMRRNHPMKKILCVCDNTYNYSSFGNLDQTSRMRQISTAQKNMTSKYKLCMIATVEYRKNMPFDRSKIKLPVNDDIADARALMYRPNLIVHVYNDLNDRGDDAEIFWTDPMTPDTPMPRLQLIFDKNKITSFKKSLTLDLNTSNVTLSQVATDQARKDFSDFQSNEQGIIVGGRLIIDANEYEVIENCNTIKK